MKTLKNTIAALSLVLAYGSTTAFPAMSNRDSMPLVINYYIDAVAHGKIDKLEEIIDSRAIFLITSGTNTRTYDKKAVINMIKSTQSIRQNCETSFKILENDEKRASIQVMYKYDDFTRVDNITMAGGRNGWKITKVVSSYI